MRQQNTNYVLHTLAVGAMEANCYIFGSAKTKEVVIIDPGGDHEKIKKLLDENSLIPKFIINTHGHIDHIGANRNFELPVYIHKDDADFLTNPLKSLSAFYGNFKMSKKADRQLQDNEEIEIADLKLKVLHTPGHTPGGISLHYNGLVFTGDTLFEGSIGRTDFPYGDSDGLINSIKEKLLSLDDSVIVLPGHGEKTTIGGERKSNPWLS
ncbi:MAG: MBL fold metallo-hydrolase [Candidatus Omnitrophota bacterium]